MASLAIYDKTGNQVGTYEIDPTAIAPNINKQLMHDVVVMYQANQRIGSAKSKSRAEVAGSTKKMYRQKGTGNARAGSRRSGVRRGGGHIFAKRPRDYSYRLPRKAIQAATRMAIASKIISEQVVVIDQLGFDAPRTRDMVSVLRALGCDGASLLVATAGIDANVHKSSRNIPRVEVLPVSDLNALCVLRPSRLLITKEALDVIRERAETTGGAA